MNFNVLSGSSMTWKICHNLSRKAVFPKTFFPLLSSFSLHLSLQFLSGSSNYETSQKHLNLQSRFNPSHEFIQILQKHKTKSHMLIVNCLFPRFNQNNRLSDIKQNMVSFVILKRWILLLSMNLVLENNKLRILWSVVLETTIFCYTEIVRSHVMMTE